MSKNTRKTIPMIYDTTLFACKLGITSQNYDLNTFLRSFSHYLRLLLHVKMCVLYNHFSTLSQQGKVCAYREKLRKYFIGIEFVYNITAFNWIKHQIWAFGLISVPAKKNLRNQKLDTSPLREKQTLTLNCQITFLSLSFFLFCNNWARDRKSLLTAEKQRKRESWKREFCWRENKTQMREQFSGDISFIFDLNEKIIFVH